MNANDHRDLISGRRRGVWPGCLRIGLRLAAVFYGWGVWWRNRAYDWGWQASERAQVPVISLGNVTAGGTGKTPFAAYVARWFRDRGLRVCFLSRGYMSGDRAVNDEALVLELLCPDVPHLQNPDRVASARVAWEELDSQLLILDDGFQHRRLARDLDIVLIDALNPWGYGRLLPGGLLREPLSALRRAGLVVITRVDQVTPETVQAIRQRVQSLCGSDFPIVEVAFVPERLVNATGQTEPLAALRNQRIVAFSGIGNPDAFLATLTAAGLPPLATRTFPDHHAYSREDIQGLADWSAAAGAQVLITTQKDLVKIGVDDLAGRALWAIQIGTQVVAGTEHLERALHGVLASVPPVDVAEEEQAGAGENL